MPHYHRYVVSCNQTAFFFFDDRTGKKRVWYNAGTFSVQHSTQFRVAVDWH